MQNKIKIAIYSGDIPSTTFIENLIEAVAEEGFEIYLFGKKRKDVSYKGSVKVFATPESSSGLLFFVFRESISLFLKDRSLYFKTYRLLKKKNKNFKNLIRNLGFILPILNNQPDIFHIQWAKTVNLNYEIYELLNSKIALSLRGAHINYSPLNDSKLKEAYLKYFPKTDAFHAVSKAIASESLKYGANEDKIQVIHSSVRDEYLVSKNADEKKIGKFEIISVGRHHWKKGYHYALDAMNQLRNENFNFSYTIIAQGDIPEEILFLMNEYNLSDHVKIMKGMQHKDLMEKLRSSDLLLLPSVEEGIANVVLEAMGSGVLVLTTDCGGMNEVIQEGVNGFIVPVRDPQAIAEKIKMIANTNYSDLKKLTFKAMETIKSEFSREKQKKEFSMFYNSLISK